MQKVGPSILQHSTIVTRYPQDFNALNPLLLNQMSESLASEALVTNSTPTDQNLLDRPDAVVLMIVAIMVAFWQLYLAGMEECAPVSLSGRSLAHRLGVDPSTISRRKEREDFHQWSQGLDPEGIAWDYAQGSFFPRLDLLVEPQSTSLADPPRLDSTTGDRASS